MDPEFYQAGKGTDWLSWIGQPMLYDGGLCVNRSVEEHIEHSAHIYATLTV